MLRPGKPGLVILIVFALLASQLVGLRLGPTTRGARASGDSAAGSTSVSHLAVAAVDTNTDTAVPTPNQSATAAAETATAQANLTAVVATLTAAASTPATPFTGSVLTILPPQGAPGTKVSVTALPGSLPVASTVTIYFADPLASNGTQAITTTVSDGGGGISVANLAVPAEATNGTATISAVAANGATVSGSFVVTPAITANPSVVPPGGTTQITGDGFAALNQITLSLNGTTIPSATGQPVTTDHLGHFVTTITIPATQTAGAALLSATDGIHASPQIAVTIGTVAGTATITPSVSPSATVVPGTPTLLPTAPPHTLTPTPAPITSPTGPGTPSGPTSAYFAEGYTGSAATNGKASFTEALDILNPNATAAAITITYYIQGNRTPQTVTRSVPARSDFLESVNTDVGLDKQVAALVTSPARVYVVRTITRNTPGGQHLDGSTTQPASAPATTWNFAEGYTGVTFQEYLTLLNPNTAPATVTIRLAPQAASATGAHTLTLNVPPQSRSTANIRALTTGTSARSVGMLITSTQPVVAERVMYFGNGSGSGKFGSTVTSGLPAPATQLRVGYGLSGGSTTVGGVAQPVGDQDFITLINPSTSGSAAHVTLSFAGATGAAVGKTATADVAPGTRQTVIANNALGAGPVGPFSVTLTSTGAIEAESAQYFGGSPNVGNHPGIALPALPQPMTAASLADLSTRLSDGTVVNRAIYLYNPNGAAEQVTVTYYGSNGATAQKTYSVPAGGIGTVNVNQDTPSTFAGKPIGAQLRASAGGSFMAYAIGRTSDNLAAFEEVGVAS